MGPEENWKKAKNVKKQLVAKIGIPLSRSSMFTPKLTNVTAITKLPITIMVFLPRQLRRMRPTIAQHRETPPTRALISLMERLKLSLRMVLE